jgi:hypothetical protein
MSVYYDNSGQATADSQSVAVTLGQAGLGGTIGVRVIVDDAVLTSKVQVLAALEAIENAISKETWPAT